jgi:hypothetical protein
MAQTGNGFHRFGGDPGLGHFLWPEGAAYGFLGQSSGRK